MTTTDELTTNYERYLASDDRWDDRRNWRSYRACDLSSADLFFPGDEGEYEPCYPSPQVKDICDHCPVRADCLNDGLLEPYGIWGGMTAYQRRQINRPRERASCPGCSSTEIINESGQEICLACGVSWPIV